MAKKNLKRAAIEAPEFTEAQTAALADAIIENTDPSVLEQIVLNIEATEAQVSEAPAEDVHEASAEVDFKDAIAAVPLDDAELMLKGTNVALDERAAFEDAKNPDNANIHRTIKKVRGSLARAYAARVMVVANQSPDFINRVLMDGSRYNVYAIGKYGDLVDALASGVMANSINIAITRSLFAFDKAGQSFTGEMAKAAASDKIRVADHLKKLLVRHTVSASTAPTQASSTMQALETLGIVAVEGSRKHPTYRLLNTPARWRMQRVVEAMAA